MSTKRLAKLRPVLAVAWRAALGALLAALPAVLWAVGQPLWGTVREHPYFRASEITIRGAGPLLSEQMVLTWLGVDERTTVWQLSPLEVRARLEAHPLVARAAVRREFPNRVSISLRERRPEAIAVLDRCYYVDRAGHLLGALGPEHSRDFPLVTGPTLETPTGLRTWLYRRAARLVRLCQRDGCPRRISEINVDATRGVVLYPTQPRAAVILGWGSWHDKLERWGRVLRVEQRNLDTIQAIDLRYRNQIVVERQPSIPAPSPRPAKRGMRV